MSNSYKKPLATLKKHRLIRFSDHALHWKLPIEGGIYAVVHIAGRIKSLLYIGKAKNLQQRLYNNLLNGQSRSHTLSRKLEKAMKLANKAAVKKFLRKECAVRWVIETNPKERSYLEHFAIAHFRSPMND